MKRRAKTKTAFAYARVSGRNQVHGDGFPRQLKAIRGYARQHAIRIVRIFQEEGVSGTIELKHRPALSEMVQALHRNGVRIVLIERLDRLARDLMVQESIIADLRRHGFQLVSVSEPDLLEDDPSRKAFRQIMGVFAEYEKSMLVAKLRGARERKKARTGRCEGRKPYGHYPGEKVTLERMKQLRRDGLGFDRIAAQLTSEARLNRVGRAWGGQAVNRILSRR